MSVPWQKSRAMKDKMFAYLNTKFLIVRNREALFQLVVKTGISCLAVYLYLDDSFPGLPFQDPDVDADLRPKPAFDLATIAAIVSATLSFLLTLQLNASLVKHKSGMDAFHAMCGCVFSMGVFVRALRYDKGITGEAGDSTTKTSTSQNNTEAMANVSGLEKNGQFERIILLLKFFPQAVKHHFRGTIDRKKLQVRRGSSKVNLSSDVDPVFAVVGNSEEGSDPTYRLQRVSEEDVVNHMFMELSDMLVEFCDNKVDNSRFLGVMEKWENMYSSWGGMGTISTYTPPAAMSWILQISTLMYSMLLPITIIQYGWNAVWMTFIVNYFFVGIEYASNTSSNPFMSSKEAFGFATVSQAARDSVNSLDDLLTGPGDRDKGEDTGNSSDIQTGVRVGTLLKLSRQGGYITV